jgi:peptidylprolyl isomerase/FKBP-type peptidyl-prolyl cis-trans isomerase FkpA
MFIDIERGTGATVAAGNELTVDYRGWLTNGQLFDESYPRSSRFKFTVGEHHVISGWEQGVLGMKAGGKRRLIIPPEFGYGAQGTSGIPANSVLVFDIWVHEVK